MGFRCVSRRATAGVLPGGERSLPRRDGNAYNVQSNKRSRLFVWLYMENKLQNIPAILVEKRKQWLVLLRMGSRSRNESILNCGTSVIG